MNSDFYSVLFPFPFSIMLSPIFASIYISCQIYEILRMYLIINFLSFWNLILNISIVIIFEFEKP